MKKLSSLNKKRYKIKVTPSLLKTVSTLWKTKYLPVEDSFRNAVDEFEKLLAKKTGIKDIEIFISESEVIGIGNTSRTMPLLQRSDLEENGKL